MIFKAVFKSLLIYKKYKITKVISVGGFSAAPASFTSLFSSVDFYIHEQNSIYGQLNKLTSKWAKTVFSSYDSNSIVKDYPIDKTFFQNSRIRKEIQTVIFLGGSQGAKAVNDFALLVAPYLKKQKIKIIHQTGKLDFQRIKKEYKILNIEVDIFDFTTNIIEKMDQSDFAVSRAGASTLWELSALGLVTLYIPYPYAASNHQYYNAKKYKDRKAAILKAGKSKSKPAVKLIFDAFEDPFWGLRSLAIKKSRKAASVDSDKMFNALMKRVKEDDNSGVRMLALSKLIKKYQDKDEVRLLIISIIEKEESYAVLGKALDKVCTVTTSPGMALVKKITRPSGALATLLPLAPASITSMSVNTCFALFRAIAQKYTF